MVSPHYVLSILMPLAEDVFKFFDILVYFFGKNGGNEKRNPTMIFSIMSNSLQVVWQVKTKSAR